MSFEAQTSAVTESMKRPAVASLMPTLREISTSRAQGISGKGVSEREQAMFGDGFAFAEAGEIYCSPIQPSGRVRDPIANYSEGSILAQASEMETKSAQRKEATRGANEDARTTSLLDWTSKDGNTLAKLVAERTETRGLMVLGPMDTMRAQAEKYKDPDRYFPVFTHASHRDFHLYYSLHQGCKEYSADTLAGLIRKNVTAGQVIRLLGCESGIDGGIARELARLLPENPIYAPNGYCELKNGKAIVYTKRPSEMQHLYQQPPRGEFVLVKP
jgi:hypothetical protein